MSVVTARLAMTQLTTVERDANAATADDWSTNPDTPDWQPNLEDLPCRAWTNAGREAVDATTTVVVEDMRLIVPLATDVTERDRLVSITDRHGNELVPGPIGIRAVLYQRDFIELVLARLS